MSSNYHSPVNYWLGLPIVKLIDWIMIADQLKREAEERANRQRVGPGL